MSRDSSPSTQWSSVRPRDWDHAMELLDEVLVSVVREKGARGVALTSQLGAGKSTSAIARIWKQAKAGKAPAKLVYVVSTEVEAALLRQHLLASGHFRYEDLGDEKFTSDNPVTICPVGEYLRSCRQTKWDTNRTVVFDVNWYSTVEDELAFGRLVAWALVSDMTLEEDSSADVHVVCIFFMSVFESQRSVEALEDGLRDVLRLDCSSIGPWIPDAEIMPLGWEGSIGKLINSVCSHGQRTVLVTGNYDDYYFRSIGIHPSYLEKIDVVPSPQLEASARRHEDLATLQTSPIVVVDPELPYSTRLSDIGLVILSDHVQQRSLLSPHLMQVVLRDRKPLWCETQRYYSWASKSVSSGSQAVPRILIPVGEDRLSSRQESAEDLGPAWNRDFMFTILGAFRTWPGVPAGTMPMRPWANDYVFADATRRLSILGCIQRAPGHDGAYEATPLGHKIMDWYMREDDTHHNFHIAHLIARAQLNEGESPAVLRSLARIAAIARCGTTSLYDGSGEFDTEQFRQAAPPLVRDRIHAGALWVGLGLYLLFERHRLSGQGRLRSFGQFVMRFKILSTVAKYVEEFEQALGLGPAEDDWCLDPLTEAQLRSIDRELMWAWLHRIVSIPASEPESEDETVVDCVSWTDFTVGKTWQEPLQLREAREYCNRVTKRRCSPHAFFLELEDTGGDKLNASGLTWLPPETFEEIPDKTGLRWPDVVTKTTE